MHLNIQLLQPICSLQQPADLHIINIKIISSIGCRVCDGLKALSICSRPIGVRRPKEETDVGICIWLCLIAIRDYNTVNQPIGPTRSPVNCDDVPCTYIQMGNRHTGGPIMRKAAKLTLRLVVLLRTMLLKRLIKRGSKI